MSDLQIRQIPFSFDGVEFLWNPANPAFSVLTNCGSFFVIGLERYLVRIMKDADAEITDPEVRAEAHLFMQQEAVHSKAHRRHVKALIDRYPDLHAALDVAVAHFDDLYERRDLRYHLAYAAALEGTFTPLFRTIIDHRDRLFRHGDARVASLFLWHFCEEIEHRSSAVNVYDHLVGDNSHKVRVFPSVVKHANRGFELLMREFHTHVPGLAGTDHYGSRTARLFGLRANPLPTVPIQAQLLTAWRAISSIRRSYDHENQPIPAWAETWFTHYDQGHDMTRFYGAMP
jgi:predicted metal-dependent hydrolase